MNHRFVPIFAIILVLLAGCGSATEVGSGQEPTVDPVATTAPVTTPEETPPGATPPATPAPSPTADDGRQAAFEQRELLTSARQRWQQNRPASYAFTFTQVCECDQGPWRVRVDVDGNATSEHLTEGATGAEAPYRSVEDVFDAIESALDDGRHPVEVTYDTTGVPVEYVYNRPELPVDGGFILRVDEFVAGGAAGDEQVALAAARQRWTDSGIDDDYEYTFSNTCFCPPQFVGPFRAAVVAGEVVEATYEGVDLFDIADLDIEAYSDRVLTVDQVFTEIDRAIAEAHSFSAEYHPELGYPTNVFIDWDQQIADEEAGYRISDLASPTRACSTAAVNMRLVPQPDLRAAVAQRRQAIFDTALTCNFDALAVLANPDGFNAGFGGGEPARIWADAEGRGEPVMLDLVRLLNMEYAVDGEAADALYTWPSAFSDLEAADGTGLSAVAYQELLQLYSVAELEDMFAGLGGYVGYRIGIDAAGNWLFFVAGD